MSGADIADIGSAEGEEGAPAGQDMDLALVEYTDPAGCPHIGKAGMCRGPSDLQCLELAEDQLLRSDGASIAVFGRSYSSN